MIMPQQSEITGHYESNWGHEGLIRMVDMVYRTGLPWRWFWDQRLDDAGDQLSGPVILPEVHCLTQSQLDCVNAVAERGEGLLWIGNRPAAPWAGNGACRLPWEVESGIFEVDSLAQPSAHRGTGTSRDPDDAGGKAGIRTGQVLGTVDGRPALVLVEEGSRREAWLAGMPAVKYTGNVPWNVLYGGDVQRGVAEETDPLGGWSEGPLLG